MSAQEGSSSKRESNAELISALFSTAPPEGPSNPVRSLRRRKSKRKSILQTILPKPFQSASIAPPPRSPERIPESCPPGYGTLQYCGPQTGDILQLDGFDDIVEMADGQKTTLKEMLDASVGGVVIFTFPQADTSECIRQANLFKDYYQVLRRNGYALYGMSCDTPESNTHFKLKYSLPYVLLCDQERKLIAALGFYGQSSATVRGVIAIGKDGRVLVGNIGTPEDTIEAVSPLLEDNVDAASCYWR